MLGIYCRISGDKEEGKDRSIHEQKKQGIKLSKILKLPYKLYIDEHISSLGDIKDRPQFGNLLDDIQSGLITHVFGYDKTRLERNLYVRLLLHKLLKENKVRLFELSGEIDLYDERKMMVDNIFSVMGEYDVRITRQKVKSIIKTNVEEGRVHALSPYGYTKDINKLMVIDEEESKVVRKIYDLAEKRTPYRKIADILNDEKIPTRYNKIGINGKKLYEVKNNFTNEITVKQKKNTKWISTTVYQICKNPTYKGERIFNGITYPVPEIITTTQWNKIQRCKNKGGRTNKHKYLLNDVMSCGKCDKRYVGRMTSTYDDSYRCVTKQYKNPTCNNRGFRQPIIEAFIWSRFFVDNHLEKIISDWFNNDPKEKIEEVEKIIIGIEKEITSHRNKRSRAIELTIDGTLSKDDIKVQLKKIDNKLEELNIILQNHMETLSTYSNSSHKLSDVRKDMHKIFFDTSFNMKKEFIKKWIKDIKIDYERPNYYITIEFNIPDSPVETYECDTKYRRFIDTSGEVVWKLSKIEKLTEEEIKLLKDEKKTITE
ncbi:recombinase family protein [Arenibacter sp. TNZ]|uniref:recombinase family protein n=1 Tax=Arenibacter TaxID=178469 RepID=UPI000CD3C365|nr:MULTISPECIES: recombinase family protein [Arenibacter]MCM4171874.1 recombinase family protein [Arenibacter sp. TNZ]